MKKKLFLFGSLGLFACFQNCAQVANNSIQFSSDVPLCVDLNPDAFAPKVKWDWYKLLDKSSSDTYPNISQVMAAPMVADLNADGAPEVVFVSWSTTVKDSYRGAGVLRIVDGRTGQTLKSIGDDNLAPYASTSPLLIDIDGDGKVEIFYSHYSGTSVVALNSDGTLRWKHSVPDLPTDKTLKNQTGFSAFDIDGDGKAEILIGQWAISEDSAKKPFQKWKAQAWVSPASAFAINLDASRPNQVRIVASNGVYDLDGDLVFTLPNSRYSAGDIDGTPGLELVGTGGGYLRIADGVTGNIKLDKDLSVHNELRCPLGIGGGPSTLGDFDGNPQTSEIALATGRYLTIFDGSGSLIAKYATQDCSSLVTGISSFDFNGDGKPEILYGDEEYLRV
ncbi:MAG: FG-GAP-like repeat-containing protein, partial [Bdellovibrionales bacterium]